MSDALPDTEGKRTFGDDECNLVTFVEMGNERSLGRLSRDTAVSFCRWEGAAVRRDPAGRGGEGRGRPF